jgi:hypothetical protein
LDSRMETRMRRDGWWDEWAQAWAKANWAQAMGPIGAGIGTRA